MWWESLHFSFTGTYSLLDRRVVLEYLGFSWLMEGGRAFKSSVYPRTCFGKGLPFKG